MAVDGALERRGERLVVHVVLGRVNVNREVVGLAGDGVAEDGVVEQDVAAQRVQLFVTSVSSVVDVCFVARDEGDARGVAATYLEQVGLDVSALDLALLVAGEPGAPVRVGVEGDPGVPVFAVRVGVRHGEVLRSVLPAASLVVLLLLHCHAGAQRGFAWHARTRSAGGTTARARLLGPATCRG